MDYATANFSDIPWWQIDGPQISVNEVFAEIFDQTPVMCEQQTSADADYSHLAYNSNNNNNTYNDEASLLVPQSGQATELPLWNNSHKAPRLDDIFAFQVSGAMNRDNVLEQDVCQYQQQNDLNSPQTQDSGNSIVHCFEPNLQQTAAVFPPLPIPSKAHHVARESAVSVPSFFNLNDSSDISLGLPKDNHANSCDTVEADIKDVVPTKRKAVPKKPVAKKKAKANNNTKRGSDSASPVPGVSVFLSNKPAVVVKKANTKSKPVTVKTMPTKVTPTIKKKTSSAKVLKPRPGRNCYRCKTDTTPKWRKARPDDETPGQVLLCNACGLQNIKAIIKQQRAAAKKGLVKNNSHI